MNAQTLRNTFLKHMRANGHAPIGGAPLIPEGDPSVLFTTAGMHPLVPFLLGEPHPAGMRLANVQACLRTNDILEVGDAHHLTLFEMLGSWSLGDYRKDQAIRQSYGFLTERLGLDPARLYVTCFAGDQDAPRDDEAAEIWRALGIPQRRILFLPKQDNWWGPAGATGPCGPDSEMFYDIDPGGPPDQTPVTDPKRFWEVGNNVFMEYELQSDGDLVRLPRHNVDLGMGLERLLPIVQGVPSIYETDLFRPIVEAILSLAPHPRTFAVRVIADHLRAAMFVLAEGVRPGNVDQPYVARRLIRRAVRYGREIGIDGHFLARLAEVAIPTLSDAHLELERNRQQIGAALDDEETRFGRTLARGEVEFERAVSTILSVRSQKPAASSQASLDDDDPSQEQRSMTADWQLPPAVLPGEVVFRLYETYGFPAELTEELAAGRGLTIDMDGFTSAYQAHQERSRQSSAGRFRGGLAERLPETTRLHTATHLLQAALRQVVGPHVEQRGSNITFERLRFDFTHAEKLSAEQIAEIEQLVNQQIALDQPVTWAEMGIDQARASGAIGLFGERYSERVKVYTIGDFSREICGGPHVGRTGELGRFRVVKESAVAAGVRRIKAVLEANGERQ
jgi:alanyl-tRNA synthetase